MRLIEGAYAQRVFFSQDITAEFAKLTGFPLEDVASALGLATQYKLFDFKGLDLPLRSLTLSHGRSAPSKFVNVASSRNRNAAQRSGR